MLTPMSMGLFVQVVVQVHLVAEDIFEQWTVPGGVDIFVEVGRRVYWHGG
jgi:hypothetical protein